MKHEKGIAYSTPTGRLVAMPFATDRNPDRWFLGAPIKLFKGQETPTLALLCENEKTLMDFVIPPGEAAKLVRLLTANSHGQLMFNVARRGEGHFELLVPPGSAWDISKYLHAHQYLS